MVDGFVDDIGKSACGVVTDVTVVANTTIVLSWVWIVG